MAKPTTDELLAAIRRLPPGERQTVVELASRQAREDAECAAAPARADSLLGLMADEPDVVDQACAATYDARERARMRT